MAKISEIFVLGKSQAELDFVDIDPTEDKPLFLDPFLISRNTDQWSMSANQTLRSYFQFLIENVIAGNDAIALDALRHLGEPNDTCLGVSEGTPRGKGIGKDNSGDILESLKNSEAVKSGLVEDIQDTTLFIENIGRDKVSDMTTNIIRRHLIDYTKKQCLFWDINLTPDVNSDFYWDAENLEWRNSYEDLLVIEGKRILLVPKYAVSYTPLYSKYTYHQHYALNYLQADHLRRGTRLVQTVERKGKVVRRFVTKKDVAREDLPAKKDALVGFSKRNREVFANFKNDLKKKAKPLQDNDIDEDFTLEELIPFLVQTLKEIPAGKRSADDYHNVMKGIAEVLFYPQLKTPVKEQWENEGRKRIDILFTNAAEEGFFKEIAQHHPAMYVPIECKNYTDDIANPEFDQLAGRLGGGKGMIGIIVCRNIKDEKVAKQRCIDEFIDSNKIVITLTDKEIIQLLEYRLDSDQVQLNEFLSEKVKAIVLRN